MSETRVRYVIQNEKGEYAFAGLYEIYWHRNRFEDHNILEYKTEEEAKEAFPEGKKLVKVTTTSLVEG